MSAIRRSHAFVLDKTHEEQNKTELAELTSEIVAAYVANNSLPVADLPGLISSVYQTLGTLGRASVPVADAEPQKPAVSVKKSITDDYLISLFDGRRFKSLKRHLSAEHGMTPDDYRTMFGLPSNYPMVAPAYARQRSELARSLGLGRKPAAKPVLERAQEPQALKKRGRAKVARE